ncbi:MAG TPA: alpha/beta hydrolase [Caulobacter sp.]|nr:alpha/beta hydrolase [Caulobacter sp.]
MGRRILLCLALLLTACGQDGGRESFVDSRTPPGLSPRFYPPEGWAWGLVQAGDYPAQRYGVSSPTTGPTAHVLILPGYGESAEAWFETAAGLNRRGYTVWVLDGAGQGGSGRFAAPRDVGHIPSLDPDLLGVKAMLRAVIPEDGRPVVLLGGRSGGVLALLAARRGLHGDGVIASAPWRPRAPGPYDEAFDGIGLGWLRDLDEPGWTRERPYRTGPPGADPYRAGAQQAWAIANPDLRMGGPSMGARRLMAKAYEEAAAALPTLPGPILLIGAPPALAAACGKAKACASRPPPPGTRGPYSHLEADPPRDAWLALVEEFVAERRRDRLAAQGLLPLHGQ